MAFLEASSTCPCGSKISASVKKPTRFQDTSASVMCWDCESKFYLWCGVDKSKPGREYKFTFEIRDLSEKACDALKAKA